jgi:hypothetical protein
MNKELVAGVMILLIAFSSIPMGIYISTYMPTYSIDLTDIFNVITGFTWLKGTHIDTWMKSVSEAEDVTQLSLVIDVTSGAVSIEEATGDVLYSVDGYEGRGNIYKSSMYSVTFEESLLNNTLFLNIKIDSGYVEIKIARDYLASIDIDMTSGVIKIDFASLENVDMAIDVSSGALVMNVGYIDADNTNISINMSSGFFTIDLSVSNDASVGVTSDIENGFIRGSFLGEKIAYGGPFTIGDPQPMLKIEIYMLSGFGNIVVSRGS